MSLCKQITGKTGKNRTAAVQPSPNEGRGNFCFFL